MSPDREAAAPDLVAVGSVATVHGIRGELVVVPLTDDPARLEVGQTVLLALPGAPPSPRRILGSRLHGPRYLLLLEGVPDRTAAERLRGARLCIREADLPELAPGQLWVHEAPGMAVATEAGEEVGTVHELLETGGERRLLVVRGPRGEVLVPFADQFVVAIDRAARRITIRPIEGLLP